MSAYLSRAFYDHALPLSQLDEQLYHASPSDEEAQRAEFGLAELGEWQFVRGATGDRYKRAVFEPTCNIAGIWAGYQGPGMKTVIPAIATAKIDFRLIPDQDSELDSPACGATLTTRASAT